jgi:formate dehydrogenase subunit delta
MMDLDRLTYMANQIARNLAPQGEAAAIAATSQHLRDYWDPRMKAAILASNRSGLDPIAHAAVEQLGSAG